MLPSTGYFKALNCPFYENGYCERPYCHFKHTRRDVNTTGTSESKQTVSKPQNASSSTVTTADKDVIEKLVSEAVKKVLADQNVTDTNKIVDKVVEGLKPKLVPAGLSSTSKAELPIAQSSKCVYNPTPIAELKRRHISIASYEPTKESKAVRRKSPDIERPWMDVIRNINSDKESKQTKIKYTPTAISQIEAEKNATHSYIPSVISENSSIYNTCDDEYIPEKRKKKERYHPKSKKRREEYVPRKPKIPIKEEQRLEDDSFDVLDELLGGNFSNQSILDNEECKDYINTKTHQSNIDNDDIDIMEIDLTKDEKESKEIELNNKTSFESNNIREADKEKLENKELSMSKDKFKEKLIKDDSKLEDSNHNKNNFEPSKNEDNEHHKKESTKKEDSKHSKSKDVYLKHNKEKQREERKDKERIKEKDKHKHSSKSNSKEHNLSSKDHKSKDKHKDSRSTSSHRSKSKDSKSEKRKGSSSSKDSKKSHKDKDKNKNEKKEKHKSRSSSSERKKKSSKSSHENSSRHDSHSSHKSSKSVEKLNESEDGFSDNIECRSDQERERCDSPEYEEFSPMYDDNLLEASDSEHDVEEECLKIFQEYQTNDQRKEVTVKAPAKLEEPEEVLKKRIAHPAAESNIIKSVGPSEPPKRLPTAQERMYERWRLMKQVAAEKASESKNSRNAFQKSFLGNIAAHSNDHQLNGNGRIRIAQVPYAKSLAREKEKVLEKAAKIVASKTVAQTSKVGARVAHVPQTVPQLNRPEPLQAPGTQKFSLNVRQFYVNAMQDICIQIYTNADDAAQRAVREEHICYEKCKALNVYKNSCMLTVHRLRKEVDQKSEQPTTSYGSISHAAVLAGKVKGTYSIIKPKKAVADIKGELLYSMLTKWIMSEQDLRDNGFPRPHPDGPKGRAKLYTLNKRGQSTPSKVPNERYCCRCNKPYMVDKHGFPVENKNCIYHYARKFTFRGESKYMCCKQDGTSEGCCDAPTHVWDFVDAENLRGYVSTFDKGESFRGVFSLDCEMCYTTQGLELTRVTVINEDCKVVFETLVKPSHPVIDYNTRFSGITEDDMKNVTTTLLDVQATFLSMFSSKTILIGHSLESDFKALKLLHETVVDTSVMFPHKNGLPFKRALKTLCSEFLRKIIQNEVSGHDSKEDAMACMELVLWKVKEEAKLL